MTKDDGTKTREPVPGDCPVFISYAGPDQGWAEWVAWWVQDAGYPVELDRWRWRVGDNFVKRMCEAIDRASIVVLLLSQKYLEPGRFTDDEWTAVLATGARTPPAWCHCGSARRTTTCCRRYCGRASLAV